MFTLLHVITFILGFDHCLETRHYNISGPSIEMRNTGTSFSGRRQGRGHHLLSSKLSERRKIPLITSMVPLLHR